MALNNQGASWPFPTGGALWTQTFSIVRHWPVGNHRERSHTAQIFPQHPSNAVQACGRTAESLYSLGHSGPQSGDLWPRDLLSIVQMVKLSPRGSRKAMGPHGEPDLRRVRTLSAGPNPCCPQGVPLQAPQALHTLCSWTRDAGRRTEPRPWRRVRQALQGSKETRPKSTLLTQHTSRKGPGRCF